MKNNWSLLWLEDKSISFEIFPKSYIRTCIQLQDSTGLNLDQDKDLELDRWNVHQYNEYHHLCNPLDTTHKLRQNFQCHDKETRMNIEIELTTMDGWIENRKIPV